MKPGPKPTPTNLKLLRGNPGKRPIRDDEPKPKVKIPECPAEIQGEAREEWDRITKELEVLGLIGDVDRAGIAAYCYCWEQWLQAINGIRKSGLIYYHGRKYDEDGKVTNAGYPMHNPLLSIANKSMKEMRAWMDEFGMTPSSRTRISTKAARGEDDEENPDWKEFG